METNKVKAIPQEVFTMTEIDINHLFKMSGLTGNKLTPYLDKINKSMETNPSAEFQTLMRSPLFKKVSQLLLEPDLKILFHSGGSNSKDELYYVLVSAEVNEVIAQFMDTDGKYRIIVFADWSAFVNWWVTLHGVEGRNEYKPIFSEQEEFETLVCAIHALDLYKRAYMESMLGYKTEISTTISVQDFVKYLKAAIDSKDNRWLLSSLFNLTPDLKNKIIALNPKHLSRIEEIGFIEKGDSSVITFRDLTRILGTEFSTTWRGAVGWQASALINGQEQALAKMFLAPTGFSNHLFSIETDLEDGMQFWHKSFNTASLIMELHEWMSSLKKVVSNEPPDQIKTNKTAGHCVKCGYSLKTGAKFCAKCGNPVK